MTDLPASESDPASAASLVSELPASPQRLIGGEALPVYTVQAQAWRVGFAPQAFAWTPWEYATDGHFDGRWDDLYGRYRTLYLGDSLLGCLLEVLARFRPDLELAAELESVVDDDGADADYPTLPAGLVPRSWLSPRLAGSAQLRGNFVDVRGSRTIAVLHRTFAITARRLGFPDLDAAALKTAVPRELTQTISSWLYQELSPPVDGIEFASRHGDEVTLWALYEQPGDDETSAALSAESSWPLTQDMADLADALRIHGLTWADC